MNDFTKDELESIKSWGEVYTEFGNSWTDKINRALIDKIQSLIDNYCEHKNVVPNYDCKTQCENCWAILL